MRHLRLIRLFFKLGVMSEMEYRANFFIHAFEALMMLATGMSVLWIVFSQSQTIAGWSWDELLVVMGLYFVCFGLVGLIVAPSVKQFMNEVWSGELDFMLIKPESHQFLATFRKVMIWNVVEIVIGMVVVTVAAVRLGGRVGFEQVAMFTLMIAAGLALLYAFWVVLGTLAFWTTKLENIMLVFFHMYEAGRWPVGLYPAWLRYSLTFVVPVAFAVTFPAQALVGRLSWTVVAGAVGLAAVNLAIASWFFNRGVKSYTSASA